MVVNLSSVGFSDSRFVLNLRRLMLCLSIYFGMKSIIYENGVCTSWIFAEYSALPPQSPLAKGGRIWIAPPVTLLLPLLYKERAGVR